LKRYKIESEGRYEIVICENPIQILSVAVSPLFDYKKHVLGQMCILHDITSRKLDEKRLEFFSTHDILTGLFNRNYFENKIRYLEKSKSFPINIIACDLNNLKRVNDKYGHAQGDEVLRQTAGLLRNTFPEGTSISRTGGDEFIVLLPGTQKTEAVQVLQKLKQNIIIFNRESKRFPIDIAIGMATCEKSEELEKVIRIADDRMYANKKEKEYLKAR
jgi:diguanylate cyclase (GGDEF)-like protein